MKTQKNEMKRRNFGEKTPQDFEIVEFEMVNSKYGQEVRVLGEDLNVKILT